VSMDLYVVADSKTYLRSSGDDAPQHILVNVSVGDSE